MKKPRISESSKRIIMLISEGLGDKEIAAQMDMPVRTVQTRIARMRKAFRCQSRTTLALKFIMFNIAGVSAGKASS